MIETAIAAQEFGRFLVPTPHFESAFFSARLIAAAGSDQQRASWLPGIADGSLVVVPAWYEAGGGDDLATINLALASKCDGFSLTGRKLFVAHATVADLACAPARDPDGAGAHVLASVDARAPGIRITAEPNLASAPLSIGQAPFVDMPVPPVSGKAMAAGGERSEAFR